MKQRKIRELVSAYVDGEARNTAKAQRLIQESEEAAKAYVQYGKLSAHMKALPEPEVHPAFATRVLATIEDEGEAPVQRPWRTVVASAVAGAAIVALTALPAWWTMNGGNGAEEAVTAVETPLPTEVDEARIVDELERRVAAGHDADAILPDAYSFGNWTASYSLPAANEEDVLVALAQSNAFDEMAVEVSTKQGLEQALSELDQAETAIFLELLEDYAEEGTAL